MKLTGPSLSDIPRHELVAAALELGVERPEQLTPEQLREKIRAASAGAARETPALGKVSLFSVARNLIASVVERGLNLPDAARVIRDTVRPSPRQRPPLPTVTLAQIYLAQGYTDKAIVTLTQVLEREPNNYTAAELYQRLTKSRQESVSESGVSTASVAVEHSSIAPGVAPSSSLWYSSSQALTRGIRDALVLVEREPKQVTVYWELSERHASELLRTGSEVRVVCYGGPAPQPRDINIPVSAGFGWAEVELLDGEIPCACLLVGQRVVASAAKVRLEGDDRGSEVSSRATFRPRPGAFLSDVIERALN